MKLSKIFGLIFSICGIIFIGIGIFSYTLSKNMMGKYIETSAVITRIESSYDDHDVYVTYIVNDETYTSKLNYYSSSMIEGDTITIYYNPNSPRDIASSDGSVFLLIVFVGLGSIFFIIGIIQLIICMLKIKKKKKVLKYNYVINANIDSVGTNPMVSINGQNPYVLVATIVNPNDGKLYTFRSEDSYRDFTPVLHTYNITTVPVYVNPKDYSEYYVDLTNIKSHFGN